MLIFKIPKKQDTVAQKAQKRGGVFVFKVNGPGLAKRGLGAWPCSKMVKRG
jgi:hypothetical protein